MGIMGGGGRAVQFGARHGCRRVTGVGRIGVAEMGCRGVASLLLGDVWLELGDAALEWSV